ncbi:stable inheritance protein KleA [Pseudomonas sp. JG-B]|uniref:stable inheritance protein KleA n=1 Tax=Pseudomonas sp. JG-B TaxID=2603214 RepID=UPI00129D62C2|nr:stable inheritance protein KleA [Pseudomonas sp. JG-B]MRK19111.1 hypothetical protein [Pseudomonas sp. JG-B]
MCDPRKPLAWMDKLPQLPPSLKALQLDVQCLASRLRELESQAHDLREQVRLDTLATEAQVRGLYPTAVIEKAKDASELTA